MMRSSKRTERSVVFIDGIIFHIYQVKITQNHKNVCGILLMLIELEDIFS